MFYLILEIIKMLFQAVYLFFDGLLSAVWECLPTFIELKRTLGNVSPEGLFALFAGAPLFLVSIASWGLKKALEKDKR